MNETPQNKVGKLKIYIGMAAGVGKTYAMLSDARKLKDRGVDVVLGYIEAHSREETDALKEGLELIPSKLSLYRGLSTEEFDIDSALLRSPQVILIDELAHTNDGAARHPKRYLDIEEILRHGIDVWTTVNIQHLESLNDIVLQTTGVDVKETVPDSFMLEANEVEIIDISPDDLRERISEGKVYGKEKIQTALENFFRQEALSVLRELALRYVADKVGREVWKYRSLGAKAEIWPTKERILVCVAPDALSTKVVREARRIASMSNADLLALSVESPKYGLLDESARKRSERALKIAQNLGAEIIIRSGSDIVNEIISTARERNVTRIVLGKPPQKRYLHRLFPTALDRLIVESGEIGLSLVNVAPSVENRKSEIKLSKVLGETQGLLNTFLWVSYLTLVLIPISSHFEASNLAMFYFLPMIGSALKYGNKASILSAILSVLFVDFFFVPPYFTFRVFDIGYFVTFSIMLLVGMIIANLASRLRSHALLLAEKERRTSELYKLSSDLTEVITEEDVLKAVKIRVDYLFKAEVRIFLKEQEMLREIGIDQHLSEKDRACVAWVIENKLPAGFGTDTLSGNESTFMPLVLGDRSLGAVSYMLSSEHVSITDFNLLEGFTSILGSALGRMQSLKELNIANIRVEEQKIRNSFLSAVSHDLRTPLASIEGASTTLLLDTSETSSEERINLLTMIADQAQRLSRMISNILDITRLESGGVKLKLDWNSIEEILETSLRSTRPRLKDRAVHLSGLSDLSLVKVDAVMIGQVFINLLENFAKYTSETSSIWISAKTAGENVEIIFEDDGPGLPIDILTSNNGVQDKINLSDGSMTFNLPGLGLMICSAVIKTHEGEFTYSTSKYGGAKFIVYLPIGGDVPEVVYE